MKTSNHPAHGPVSLDRLHQISEILSKAAAQSDGGNLGYAMADAVKVFNGAIAAFGADPSAEIREDLGRLFVKIIHPSILKAGDKLYTAPPAPRFIPDELTREEYRRRFMMEDNFDDTYRGGWNACRAAMLQDGNSPETPDGWVMVPKEMTDAIGEAIAMQANCCGGIALDIYDAMLAAAPQQE